ncbi:MAG TPA: IS1595 family transposase [bacterium]|jgi:transposase-like protein
MTLAQIGRLTEEEARQHIENLYWPDGPVCPHCGNKDKIYTLTGKAHREGLYKCAACRKQFTVTVGTVMHRSHLTCKEWLIVFHLMTSSKKGMSALQIKRELGKTSYQSAWFLCHRIRAAMELMGVLQGTVEVDETYVGGKKTGRWSQGRSEKKTPVLAMIERDGRAYSRKIPDATKDTLHRAIKETVLPDSRIMTDEWKSYGGIGKHFEGGHQTVCHSRGEYARGDVNTNSAEAYFALLKRGVHGTFHHVSKKHLGRYCHEFSFRWSFRKVTDAERCDSVIANMGGKRLTYSKLTEEVL